MIDREIKEILGELQEQIGDLQRRQELLMENQLLILRWIYAQGKTTNRTDRLDKLKLAGLKLKAAFPEI